MTTQTITGVTLQTYYCTFGMTYREQDYPFAINGRRPHPDGYVTIQARDAAEAYRLAGLVFGRDYAFVYPDTRFEPGTKPLGELFTITA